MTILDVPECVTLSGQPCNQSPSLSLFRLPYSVSRESGVVSGLDGAIQRIVVNGDGIVEHVMERATDSGGVSRYEGPPCDESPCLNGGACRPFLRSFVCSCPEEFVGHQCERREQRSQFLYDYFGVNST